MNLFEQQVIEQGDSVTLRALSSFTPEGSGYSERVYKSSIQRVYDDGRLRIKLPVEYGDVVPLSLDRIYEIVITNEQQETYQGRGIIMSRFRDQDGGACIFSLKEALSLRTKKQFLSCETRIMGKYVLDSDQQTGHGVITILSMDYLVLESERYLEEKTKLSLEATLDNGRELILKGTVRESLRLRSGAYECEIGIDPGESRQQKELARWLLRHADDTPEN